MTPIKKVLMEKFTVYRGIVAPLDRANVDTDQIIAKQFLKSIKRTGFGEHLFFDWRYLSNGKPDPAFPLNDPRLAKASILVARNNFGCGSSREHAVWAIQQYGFHVVIASWEMRNGAKVPAFADIFRNNAMKNSLLAIELSSEEVEQIFSLARVKPGLEATVDLLRQTVTFYANHEVSFHFEVDPAEKVKLIQGLDDIGLTLKEEVAIRSFEAKHNAQKYY